MKDSLPIYYRQTLIGHLSVDRYGMLIFQYDGSFLVSDESFAISCSLPLGKEEFYGNQAHSFFTGLLPEDQELIHISKAIGTNPGNAYRILKELGRETIGGLTIGQQEHDGGSYKLISDTDLAQKIRSAPDLASMLYLKENVRLSLAGAQSKISLLYKDGQYYLPVNGATSNLIVKPQTSTYKGIVENEYLTMQLAKMCGISTANSLLINPDGVLAYGVERFDRVKQGNKWLRLLQEDFCQATSVLPIHKYEKDGGPGFSDCIQLLKDYASVPSIDIPNFIDLFAFNYIVGNRDAHGKNFSLLARKMAPAYDLVSTSFYPNLNDEMAMSINGIYFDDLVQLSDVRDMARQSRLSPRLVLNRFYQMIQNLQQMCQKLPRENVINQEFYDAYVSHITERTKQIAESLEMN